MCRLCAKQIIYLNDNTVALAENVKKSQYSFIAHGNAGVHDIKNLLPIDRCSQNDVSTKLFMSIKINTTISIDLTEIKFEHGKTGSTEGAAKLIK